MTQIVVIFDNPGMTAEHYQAVDMALSQRGLREPEGRAHHFAAATETGWYVLDIWASREQFEAFAESLLPIMEQVGVQPPPPRIYPLHQEISRAGG